MADTPTVSLAGIAELLLSGATRLEHHLPENHAELCACAAHASAMRAAADYAARLAGVLADPVLDFALRYVSEERWIDLYNAQADADGYTEPNDIRERAAEIRARLREFAATPTEEKADQ